MKKTVCFILSILLILSLTACAKKKQPEIDLDFENVFEPRVHAYSLDVSEQSDCIFLTEQQARDLAAQIAGVEVNYEFSELYQLEECYERFACVPSVDKHASCALDASGQLTPEHLCAVVKENNQKQLEIQNFLLDAPTDDDLLDICRLIVMTVEELYARYPDIDKDRVACNLANLKIFFKGGMLNFAEVTPDLVLHISETSEMMVQTLYHEDAYRNTLMHETVHIVQLGCPCEDSDQVKRRCGFSYSYKDFEMNTTDNTWLPEGSAEDLSSLLSGDDSITYLYMIDYINSLNMATMYGDGVPAYYAQSLSFYEDIQVLFDLFDCQTKQDKDEVLSMLISVNLIQMQPDEFYERYDELYGTNTAENEDEQYDVFFRLKPDICLTFAKQYFTNMAHLLAKESSVTTNDVCFMVQMFEAAMNGHMSLSDEKKLLYNQEFLDQYRMLRASFFDAVDESNGTDFEAFYNNYRMFDTFDDTTANASMRWSDSGKTAVYLDRLETLLEFSKDVYKVKP